MKTSVIEAANKEDVPAIIALINKIFEEYDYQLCLEQCDSDLLDIALNYYQKGGAFWIIKNNDQAPIACIAVCPKLEVLAAKKVAELKRFYVQKNYRGTGISQQLLQHFFDWVRKNQYEKVMLWTDTKFERAHAFYQKMGFQKTGSRNMTDFFVPYSEYQFTMDI